jgi:transcriptional regulator with XRE-family HTH domain
VEQDPGFTWLDEQLRLADIDIAELARRGGFSDSSIAHAKAGRRKVGQKLAQGIARGLGVSQTRVYQEFGLFDEEDRPTDEALQLSNLLMAIEDPEERKRTMGILQAVIQQVIHSSQPTQRLGDGSKPRAANSRARR